MAPPVSSTVIKKRPGKILGVEITLAVGLTSMN